MNSIYKKKIEVLGTWKYQYKKRNAVVVTNFLYLYYFQRYCTGNVFETFCIRELFFYVQNVFQKHGKRKKLVSLSEPQKPKKAQKNTKFFKSDGYPAHPLPNFDENCSKVVKSCQKLSKVRFLRCGKKKSKVQITVTCF